MGAVEVRVVDQAFPADGGPWFFKVNPHHQQQLILELIVEFSQASGVFKGRFGIMNRAGADNDHHARITIPEDVFDLFTGVGDELCGLFR